jgi:uncharacterized membrane protein YeaQ/YmgE (transglycosylase-associated protein family)
MQQHARGLCAKLNAESETGDMHYVIMAVIGLLVGAVAKLLMPGKDPGGIIVTSLLGIAGSIVAGYLAPQIGWHPRGVMQFAASVLGAMLLLILYRLVFSRRSRD